MILNDRVQKVQRYSFQRPFIEVYRLGPGWDAWRHDAALKPAAAGKVAMAVQPAKKLLPRGVLEPDFALRTPVAHVAGGKVAPLERPAAPWRDRSLTNIGPKLKGYPERELAIVPSLELQKLAFARVEEFPRPYAQDSLIEISAGTFRILDLGTDLTGTLGATVQCVKPARLYLTFDEILSGGDVDFHRLGCVNALTYDLQPGVYRLESIEPYTLRYLKLICTRGACRIENVYLREVAHPALPQARFAASDPRLDQLFAAGVETFRQNAAGPVHGLPVARAGGLAVRQLLHRPNGRRPGRRPAGRAELLRKFPLAQKFSAPARRHAADVLPGRSQRRGVHPQLGDVVRDRAGGIRGAERRPGVGRRAASQGAAAVAILAGLRKRRRPLGEAAGLGVRRVVGRQPLRRRM